MVGQSRASLIFHLLLSSPGIDFTSEDVYGRTPVKIAERYILEKVTSNYIYPLLVKKTEEARK